MIVIAWTRVHPIDAPFVYRDCILCPRSCHVAYKRKFMREHSPTRKKRKQNGQAYKAGRFNAIALLPQSYNQGPLTRGPSKCQPPLATWCPLRHLCGLSWPLPRIHTTCAPPARRVGSHGSAMWPCVPRYICAGSVCHISSARHVSSTGFAENNPLFGLLKIQ